MYDTSYIASNMFGRGRWSSSRDGRDVGSSGRLVVTLFDGVSHFVPLFKEVSGVLSQVLSLHLSVSVLIMPGFDSSQEMDHLDPVSEVLVRRQVGVTSVRVDVVREGDVFTDITVGPSVEVGVEQALVAPIKRALFTRSSYQCFVRV